MSSSGPGTRVAVGVFDGTVVLVGMGVLEGMTVDVMVGRGVRDGVGVRLRVGEGRTRVGEISGTGGLQDPSRIRMAMDRNSQDR